MTPTVLIGIVTRNRASILPNAIRSALSQDYPSIRVAVIDDGSSDETSALKPKFPTVKWLSWTSGRGLMAARNHLMQNSKEDYFVSLDDDAWFLSGNELALAVEHMERHPKNGAIAFDILSPDRSNPTSKSTPTSVSTFIGCGHMLRLSALRECGFYSESPGLYGGEEKDLSLRLLDKNWEVQLMPGVHVWHDRTKVARDGWAQHRSGVCNDLVFALRRCPMPLALVVVPVKLFNHLRFGLGHGLLRPCLSGIGLFARNTVSVLRSRVPVRSRTFGEYLRRSHGLS